MYHIAGKTVLPRKDEVEIVHYPIASNTPPRTTRTAMKIQNSIVTSLTVLGDNINQP